MPERVTEPRLALAATTDWVVNFNDGTAYALHVTRRDRTENEVITSLLQHHSVHGVDGSRRPCLVLPGNAVSVQVSHAASAPADLVEALRRVAVSHEVRSLNGATRRLGGRAG
jgi:hypothetical protein